MLFHEQIEMSRQFADMYSKYKFEVIMGRAKWEYEPFYKVVRTFIDTRRHDVQKKKEQRKQEQAYPSAVLRTVDCPNLFYKGHCIHGQNCWC